MASMLPKLLSFSKSKYPHHALFHTEPKQPPKQPHIATPALPPTLPPLLDKLKNSSSVVADYVAMSWDYYEKLMKVVGPVLGTAGIILYLRNKELEKERKSQNEEIKRSHEMAIQDSSKNLEIAIQEFRSFISAKNEFQNSGEEKVGEIISNLDMNAEQKILVGERITKSRVLMAMFLKSSQTFRDDIVKTIIHGKV